MEALATPFPLPAASLLSFLHSAQGTSLVGFPSFRRVMNIPYWGCGSKLIPRKSQISQWPLLLLLLSHFSHVQLCATP